MFEQAWVPWALALGVALCVGSFLNVVVYRLPRILMRGWLDDSRALLDDPPPIEPAPAEHPYNLSIPRSHCPGCGRQIRAIENVPVLSWLVLRGRCAGCAQPISLRYPFVELLCAVLSMVVLWRLGFSVAGVAVLLLTWVLLAAALIDHDTQLLPDSLTLPLVWGGLLVNIPGTFTTLPSAVVGAAAGYLVLWGLFHTFRLLTGKEGMGYGDFKLLAAAGAWCGWELLPATVLLASAGGAIFGLTRIALGQHRRDQPMPFGPWIAAGFWVALLWRDDILRVWLG